MGRLVDARGFSCPQPVIMTMNKMKELGSGQIEILVDTDTSKENVSRAATSKGWRVAEIRSEGSDYRLTITK
jgi:tRNA 2-thiouridine synthesizing protein A